MSKIETRTAFIWLYETNVIWTDHKNDVEIDEKDMYENLQASLGLTNGHSHVVVLDTRDKNVSITHEAMRYGASAEMAKYRMATALITNSISERLFGNFFMKFFKHKLQNRIFAVANEALAWLRTFIVEKR